MRSIIMSTRLQGVCIHSADHHDPDQRQRDEHLPAQAHDLVVAVAREGGAEPEEHDTTTNILASSQHERRHRSSSSARTTGDSQPPRNMTEVSVEIRIMFTYSARKNSGEGHARVLDMWPATISDSPSTTSNGARLVSATPEMKYTRNIGNSGSQFQDRKLRPMPAK